MSSSKLSIMMYFIMIISLWTCQRSADANDPPFETSPTSVPVSSTITEASGIAESKMNPGSLWVHEDSGHPPQLLLLAKTGLLSKAIIVNGADNIDWEDMSLSNGPNASLNYVYLADVGDNPLTRSECAVYRFPEPSFANDTVWVVDKIRFQYPDGAHDAEALLVEIRTKDIFIITKSDNPSRIYKLSYPQSTTSLNQATLVGNLTLGGVTGAAMSPDGKEILIKTYPALNYFVIPVGETVEKALQRPPLNLAYRPEAQGEAVCFASDNSGFYTLSEKATASSVNLFFYKRK